MFIVLTGCSVIERASMPTTGSFVEDIACQGACEEEKRSFFPEDMNVRVAPTEYLSSLGGCRCEYAYYEDYKLVEGWMSLEDFNSWYLNK